MLTHTQAKTLVDSLGVTPNESLYMRMVALHETSYGAGWKPPGNKSHNMGAITTAHPDSLSFRYGDSDPDSGTYTTWFAGYPDDLAGFKALRDTLLKDNVKVALANNDWLEAAQAQYNNGYYRGNHTHSTSEGNEANVNDYHKANAEAGHKITAETGESDPNPLVVTERAEEGT
jgi:hypothetical protein